MKKRQKSIMSKIISYSMLFVILALWTVLSHFEIVPAYMLPSPIQVILAFFSDKDILLEHTLVSLGEAFAGLSFGLVFAFISAVLMDHSKKLYHMLYPVFIITQTIPTIAIAPLLVLWMGYGIAPKIFLIFLVCFFPVTVALLDGFKSVDDDAIKLLKSMGATRWQILYHIKLPFALPDFFAGLKVSVSYCVIGAVIAEWLGGDKGLGVYMTRVRKSYAFDKMFAVIFLVSIISLALMGLTGYLEKRLMPWKTIKNRDGGKQENL